MLVRSLIEMMGAPKEHVESTLKGYVETWKENGVKIKKENYAEMEERDGLWSTFVELEVEFDNAAQIMGFALDALPASMEVMDPEQLEFQAQDMTALLNDMLGRLHETDMVVKNLRSQLQVIDKNALNTFRNFISYALRQEAMALEDIAKVVGADEKQLKPFLDKMLEENLLKLVEGKYTV